MCPLNMAVYICVYRSCLYRSVAKVLCLIDFYSIKTIKFCITYPINRFEIVLIRYKKHKFVLIVCKRKRMLCVIQKLDNPWYGVYSKFIKNG